jgi:AraC family transcriptional regulator, regulatory protein of adaptative response / DNA-3-methyladenine glycosylase II
VIAPLITPPPLRPDIYARAVDARDPRFDGVFFVAITTTRVYCRPACPSRLAKNRHRRFFDSAAAAERAGYRPCLRCRPELAPGVVLDALSKLAQLATQRISAGGLNGRSVAALAGELGVSDRHLRRALEQEIGVSPVELAQTHRLLLAKRLLVDSRLSVTQVAYASGFQSLRRFNAAFRQQYRMSPSALRRGSRQRRTGPVSAAAAESIRLTLAYRAPFAWDALLVSLGADPIPGVEQVSGQRYARTVRVGNHTGYVVAEDAISPPTPIQPLDTQITLEVSTSLVPVLMPLIARLRKVFDLDAEPTVVDRHLEQSGLSAMVAKRPGIRVPGAFDGFEAALRAVLSSGGRRGDAVRLLGTVARSLGDRLETGIPGLTHLSPTAERIAEAGAEHLSALGVPARLARVITALACAVTSGTVSLDPGGDGVAMRRTLRTIEGIGDRLATAILLRTLCWPDAFPCSDRALQKATGLTSSEALLVGAERWRPWRAYAAQHLWLEGAFPILTNACSSGYIR